MPETEYSPPRSVRLHELEEPVSRYLEKTGSRFSGLVKKAIESYFSGSGGVVDELATARLAEEVKTLRRDLGRVGGSLNQIAHYFNVPIGEWEKIPRL